MNFISSLLYKTIFWNTIDFPSKNKLPWLNWQNLLWILSPQYSSLRTVFGIFGHWGVVCRRNARLSYKISILELMMTSFTGWMFVTFYVFLLWHMFILLTVEKICRAYWECNGDHGNVKCRNNTCLCTAGEGFNVASCFRKSIYLKVNV